MSKDNRVYRTCIAIIFALLPGLVFAAQAGKTRAFKLRSGGPDGWSFVYTPGFMAQTNIAIDGKDYILFASEAGSAQTGAPKLPVDFLSLGIPAGSSVSAELQDAAYETIPDQLVAPVPSNRITAENEAVAEYRKDPKVYARNEFYPAQPIAVESPYVLRQQRMTTIRVSPYRYNPGTRILQRLVHGTIRVRLIHPASQPGLQSTRPAGPDPYFEDVYRGLLDNYEEARGWRQAVETSSPLQDSTRDWFETGRTYFRIPVVQDGWYRIGRADLERTGSTTSPLDTSSLKILANGMQVPVVVRSDSSFEFYARRNYGDSSYYDFYTDTSAYWLTWGGSPGNRFVPSPQVPGPPVAALHSANTVNHFEQNTQYFVGTTEEEISRNSLVPGEGWVWEYYYPNTTITHSFALDSIDYSAGTTALLRVRLFSTTLHVNTPDHRARFWINDSLAGELAFNGRTEGLFTATIPVRWLVIGTNKLKVTSVATLSSVNQFYLDWFEIVNSRILRCRNNQLRFSLPATGGGPMAVTVTGFSSPQIDILDLDGNRRILGGIVSGNGTTGYAVTFNDTVSTGKSYMVVSTGGAGAVLPVVSKTFKDVRSNQQGADYIIVTHHDFLTAAGQLASQRQTFNGVRTSIVDVQDLYDEFNYGVMSAMAIKRFLSYAYYTWTAPAPTFVLFLGDASWDTHHYLSTSIKTNFVPAYGVPAGDNWYGCFDSVQTFLPSLLMGRIPVGSPDQAQKVIAKVIGYDNYVPDEWNKNFLFISGGTTTSEQTQFNGLCDFSIGAYVLSPPMGGTAFRVYKSTPNTIDGEHKQELRDLVKRGMVFLNFLGHSGGRIWGVDIGSPNDLENTNGRLPFVSSVSCNVGAFAEPSSNVLSEDFIQADNRGAVAMWASSSIGYANIGATLNNYFLSGVKVDSVRGFGALTTTARLKLWQGRGSDYVTVASVNLNPFFGDPLSQFAVPLKPDLAVSPQDFLLNTASPAPGDSTLSLQLMIHNFGLVPTDSIHLSITDTYNGSVHPVVSDLKLPPTFHRDSVTVLWHAANEAGLHTLRTTLDPDGRIDEVTKANNAASIDQYVYANSIAVIRPLPSTVVPPGPQPMVVTVPGGRDPGAIQYTFQIDTVDTFDSPLFASSGAIVPGPVSAQWTTPALMDGLVYYWRARTSNGSTIGQWVTSDFSVSGSSQSPPVVRWREYARGQFARTLLQSVVATDTGVTIAPQTPDKIYVRSLGNRANINKDYYSIFRFNEQTIYGLWWVNGNSFMTLRLNEATGVYDFRPYDVAGQAALADSMASFINLSPVGNYIAISVIFDGRTNVNASLRLAIKSLGSTLIDSLRAGDAWSFIGRKGASGPGMVPLEHWSRTAIAEDSLIVPNYYRTLAGTTTSTTFPTPARWRVFHWRGSTVQGTNDIRVALLGVRNTARVDTLRLLSRDSSDVDVSSLNLIAQDPAYVAFKTSALLTTSDALSSPAFREWALDFEPAADLAISAATVGTPNLSVPRGTTASIPVTVYNLGYRRADSVRVLLAAFDATNTPRTLASDLLDSIGIGGSRTTTMRMPTSSLPRQVSVQATISPAGGARDLNLENNVVEYTFSVTGTEAAGVQVFSDGVQLMDGDYISPTPKIIIRLPAPEGLPPLDRRVELFVDNSPVLNAAAGLSKVGEKAGVSLDDPTFSPVINNGSHVLETRVIQVSALGGIDTLRHQVTVNVLNEYQILRLFNYPNPFASDTYFTFVLTGARPPEDVTIRIFTVSGRKIREMKLPPSAVQIGFNRVYWDGRDNDGDEIANGYYFYQVQVTGDGKTMASIQKLVKVR